MRNDSNFKHTLIQANIGGKIVSKEKEPVSTKKAMIAVGDGVLGAGLLVALGAYFGHIIDQKIGSTPWLTIVLSISGAGLGLARLVQKAIKLDKEDIQ